MKRTLCSALACLMLLPTSALAVQATPNHQLIVRNGQEVSLAGYEIDGYTYFKLRDVAAILNGTEISFRSTTMARAFPSRPVSPTPAYRAIWPPSRTARSQRLR